MTSENTNGSWTGAPEPSPLPEPPARTRTARRRVAGAATVGGLVVGGLLGGYVISHAATSAASPSPTASPSGPGYGYGHDGPGGPHAGIPGGRDEDLQVVATAIGVSTSDLQTALRNGQTIAAVAKAHNVDVSKVISALAASESAEIDSALKAGSITQAQANQMKSMVQQRVTDMVNGTGPMGGHRGHGPGGLQGEDLTLVAGVIGISTGDLQTALQNGQTIAAVAKAHNVDVNAVISTWVASENKEIDDRASSGQITAAQATQMKAQTQQRVTDMVNGVRPAGGPGRGGFGGPGPDAPNGGNAGTDFGGPPPGGPSV